MVRFLAFFIALLPAFVQTPSAGEVDVVGVEVMRTADATYRFDVTLRHADAGWDHYADRWDVVAPDGIVLGARELLHPHDTEQPFTRSLDSVRIPAGVTRVTIRGHDKVHGLGGTEMTVDLPSN